MSGILESKAYFKGRLAVLNLSEFEAKFNEADWNTMSAFAFSSNYVPGRSDESVFVAKVVKKILGEETHKKEHALRRLFFEAHTMASMDVQRRMAHPEEEGKHPRKLPLEERGERLKEIKLELAGLNIRGELEPSNALVDKFVEMEELNELRNLKWEELTKRDQESKGVKKIPLWSENDGKLCRIYKDEEVLCKTEDLLQLKYSLQRRGIAMQMARILSFRVHEKLVDYYFEEMSREPPNRYEKVSLEQVARMDKEVFRRLGELTRDGFKFLGNPATKEYPLDKLLEGALLEPRLVHLMLPLPLTSRPASSSSGEKKRDSDNQLNQLRGELKKLKAGGGGGKGGKGGGKNGGGSRGSGGGKDGGGKATGGKKQPTMPKELRGMLFEVDGKRLCYAYNMKSGCSTRGVDKCSKGHHLCCYPGCGGDHCLHSCSAYHKNLALGGKE